MDAGEAVTLASPNRAGSVRFTHAPPDQEIGPCYGNLRDTEIKVEFVEGRTQTQETTNSARTRRRKSDEGRTSGNGKKSGNY